MRVWTSIFAIALLGLSFSATETPAQQQGLKEAITGAWIITSVYDEYASGEKRDNWGGPVKGQITFGRTGRFPKSSLVLRWRR
jgi:hypothetical protein